MVPEALVPRGVVKDALTVHLDPRSLKSEDTSGSEVYTRIVEVVADGNEGGTILHCADLADIR